MGGRREQRERGEASLYGVENTLPRGIIRNEVRKSCFPTVCVAICNGDQPVDRSYLHAPRTMNYSKLTRSSDETKKHSLGEYPLRTMDRFIPLNGGV